MSASAAQALVLTTPPSTPCLNGTLTDTILRILAKDAVISHRWLANGEAWELIFVAQADGGERLKKQAATVLIGLPVDINVVPADRASGTGGDRRKRLLVADMDSTIIEQECIDEIADFAGVRAEVAEVTERAMRGELDFETALSSRVALLEGLSETVLDEIIAERITVMPGAHALVATMQAHGATAALVSGGFTVFTERVAARVGFDVNQANVLEIRDGRLLGTVTLPILGREAKLEALRFHAGRLGLPLSATLAIGDGANDLAMIRAAGLGVAFRAKPVVANDAAAAVRHGNLKAALYLQGYHDDEIVD